MTEGGRGEHRVDGGPQGACGAAQAAGWGSRARAPGRGRHPARRPRTAGRRRAARWCRTARRGASRASGAPAAPVPTGVPSGIVDQLVAWVPTEILTVWVALLAVLNDPKAPRGKPICQADWHVHWELAIGASVLAIAVALGFAHRKFKDTPGATFKMPWFAMFAAPAAFLAWAIALP